MNLAQWDIVRVRINPDDRDEHPAVDCSFYHVILRDRIVGLWGHVSSERIYALKRKLRDVFGL